MKKTLLLLVLLLFIMSAAMAEAPRPEGVDVIMILDCSNSMQKNDPAYIMPKAAMNFIDMCDMSNSRIAVLPFNNNRYVNNFSSINQFVQLDTVNNRNIFREKLITNLNTARGIYYASGEAYTDTGAIFSKAWELYESRGNANQKAIVLFFSDGATDVYSGRGDERKKDVRLTEESLNKANEIVDRFAEKNVPIYVIGLKGRGENYDGNWLREIANKTDTVASEIVAGAENVNNLHEMFSAIFAEYIGTVPINIGEFPIENNQTEITLEIPNNSILESNIVLRIENPVALSEFREISILDPNGTEIPIRTNGTPEAGSAVVGNAGLYCNVKLIKPIKGQWKIRVSTQRVSLISAEMLANYDLALRFEELGNIKKNDRIRLKAVFYSTVSNQVYTDTSLYTEDMMERILATKNGEVINGFQFRIGDDGVSFVGDEVVLDSDVEYQFQIVANKDGIQADTGVKTISVVNQRPVLLSTEDIPEKIIRSVEDFFIFHKANPKYEIDLEKYFADADGDVLHYIVNYDQIQNGDISYKLEGTNLSIENKKPYSGRILVKSNDGKADSEKALVLHFEVYSETQKWTQVYLIALAALIVLIIIAKIWRKKTRPRYHQSAVMELSFQGIDLPPEYSKFGMLAGHGDKTIDLYTLLTERQSGASALNSYKSILQTILLRPQRNDMILVSIGRKDSAVVLSVAGSTVPPGGTKMSDKQVLRVRFAGESIYIECKYRIS